VNAAAVRANGRVFRSGSARRGSNANGKKIENARFLRVLHNGLAVQENVEVDGPTRSHMPIAEAPLNPLMLQGDHGPVAYRNIYVRPLRPIVYH
jgi:hypothetical protein